jgi:putative ABC transport system permease protein
MLDDIRFALRGFHRNPELIVATILTLALGTGANITIFSVVQFWVCSRISAA